jgi:hypothetical protein
MTTSSRIPLLLSACVKPSRAIQAKESSQRMLM